MLLTETTISTFTGDYIVEAYITLPGDKRPDWHKVLNFGTRQGDAIELAYGKVSMDPFDYSNAFKELLKKVGYEIH